LEDLQTTRGGKEEGKKIIKKLGQGKRQKKGELEGGSGKTSIDERTF